ncbi:MAG TPA: cob(I)yrinic acid a,c-diamide adenosyltransferase [Chthoniobacterales bacterium]|nr:cob(I)yrinic acid a,c-diamide adenosyltransferase [Chthoniobacterales bacterium]
MSIVTKTGDSGETSLMYGRRVPKSDPRVDAYGCIDELTAALGFARSISEEDFVNQQILATQKELIIIMGELSTLPEDRERYTRDRFNLTGSEMVERLTRVVVDLEKDESLYPKDWVIPGATAASAAFDFARTICRRAERRVIELREQNPEILRYLNRLSDWCWILARYLEKQARNKSQKAIPG